MTLLGRYVGRQFLLTVGGLVLGLPLLFIVVDLTDNLGKYFDRGLGMGEVALSYMYQLPLFVQYSIPIAALVGTVFTIGGMTTHVEITAAKAAGISFYRIAAPIWVLAAVLAVASLALGELVPVTNRLHAQILKEIPDRQGVRTDFVFQTENGEFLSVRRLDPEQGSMRGVVLEQPATGTTPGLHGVAESAQWNARSGWRMERGFLRYLSGGGQERTFGFDTLRIPAIRETPKDLLAEPEDADEMGYREISRAIDVVERSGGDARPLRTNRAQKVALPLATLIIVLFGAPLATSTERGGAAYGVGISLAVTLIYLMLFKVGGAVGASGAIDPLLAAWFPNLLFLVGSGWLLWRVRT